MCLSGVLTYYSQPYSVKNRLIESVYRQVEETLVKLYRLIYASDQIEYLGLAEFQDIVVKSEQNNARLNITGLLVILTKKFLQVLEGPSVELNGLYEKIMRDSRHKNPRLISYMPIHNRHFMEWSMKGINWSKMKPRVMELFITKYGEADGCVAVPDDPWQAYSLLYDIYCGLHFADWSADNPVSEPVIRTPQITTADYSRYRVLVVEDDAVVRRIILRMLQQMGFLYLSEADDGAIALREVDKIPPDLILCDIQMKPMDGLSFLQVLRNTQHEHCPKFVFLTGHTEQAIINRAHELGVDAFITKPVKIDQLRYQINSVLTPLATP